MRLGLHLGLRKILRPLMDLQIAAQQIHMVCIQAGFRGTNGGHLAFGKARLIHAPFDLLIGQAMLEG